MRSTFFLLLVALASLVAGQSPAGPARKLPPVDEAAKDPSFFVFRSRLIEAVAARDTGHLLGILSPTILNSFGGSGGIEEFKQQWKPEAKNSELWPELARILSLGGKFAEDGSFAAPYIYATWPEDDDAFDFGAIVGGNVRVREKPDANSAVLARLSFEMVNVLEFASDRGPDSWAKVKLADGRTGFVSARFVGHAMDRRAIFEKQNGEWRLTALVAGD